MKTIYIGMSVDIFHHGHINIIEKLAEGSYFNFFNVALQHNTPTVIRMINEN